MSTNRNYLAKHSFIDFRLDLASSSNFRLWMLLGEASSKCEHIKGTPLRPEIAKILHELYLAKGARATTAIEGNTLSEEDVTKLVRGELELPPSKEYLGTEVDNVLEACNDILESLSRGKLPDISLKWIEWLNFRVLNELKLDEGIVPGEIRSHSVGVGRYLAPPPQDCLYLVERLCEWLNSEEFRIDVLGLGSAILKAIIAHLYLAWIHPFGDGNGRTARLVEYQILVASGVPSPAAHLMSNHYNETRSEYYRQLDRSSQTPEGVTGFIMYALQGFVDGLGSQIDVIRKQQWEVTWENYVHDVFRDRNSAADVRRRHLVLDLSLTDAPVRPQAVRSLSPRLAEAYAGKTAKTITRDLNVLEELGLIRRTRTGVVPRKDIILAFLPVSASAGDATPFASVDDPEQTRLF